MKEFLNDDFLLNTKTAQDLFHSYAEKMPIIDYHCHLDPKEIYENKPFDNISQLWLAGDHYKWRQMRANGVAEEYITGKANDYDKFVKWVETLENAIGNPLYHWCHLELKQYFGYLKPLTSQNVKEVWEHCNEVLKKDKITPQKLIDLSNVDYICTTDDPIDDLSYHKLLKEEKELKAKVLPTFRPDLAGEIEKKDYLKYIVKLEKSSGVSICSFEDLKAALRDRMDYFEMHGCVVADHGLNHIPYLEIENDEPDIIFQKARKGEIISQREAEAFRLAFLMFCSEEYHERNWVMQLHYGCKRDNNTGKLLELGVNTGFDCINSNTSSENLANFLDALEKKNALPKTIIYSLNPVDNAYIGTIIGCFAQENIKSKVQHGSAWWFNDTKTGIQEQMTSLANLGLLGNFIGMLTDSRSFLSYVRHEYFRRILCNLIGNWVEEGEFPNDEKALKRIIENISYYNAKRYFGFESEK